MNCVNSYRNLENFGNIFQIIHLFDKFGTIFAEREVIKQLRKTSTAIYREIFLSAAFYCSQLYLLLYVQNIRREECNLSAVVIVFTAYMKKH
jgi:hypothetical protein